MNKVLKYGVVGALGVLGGVAVSKVIRKVVKTVTKDEPEEVTMMVEKGVCCAVATASIVYGAKIVVDSLNDKTNASMLLSLINSAELGTVEKEDVKEVVKYVFPKLHKRSQDLLKPFINHSFPELLGGE